MLHSFQRIWRKKKIFQRKKEAFPRIGMGIFFFITIQGCSIYSYNFVRLKDQLRMNPADKVTQAILL